MEIVSDGIEMDGPANGRPIYVSAREGATKGYLARGFTVLQAKPENSSGRSGRGRVVDGRETANRAISTLQAHTFVWKRKQGTYT